MENEEQQPQVLATEYGKVIEGSEESNQQHIGQGRSSSFPIFYGKHRLQAAISQLNNQINIIQEELGELETMGESSMVCKSIISSVESIPDPLLPFTKGSVDASWDRWFGGGSHNSRNHKHWINRFYF
ncbi:PREDICTED: guanine nucleotide-binding protein subunit gamma 2-like [Lupinus angustifolius]|uniref:guanine nucleotide-binding protein subunit gamma 2-like n=1 Tax=Lupinus angustifolius TaxID=3871 RepID=UPI00092F981D|nr:PREDICTED: guanine nucleotide-binding protein subunit gamma 2-like [Lupinus angustifolius]